MVIRKKLNSDVRWISYHRIEPRVLAFENLWKAYIPIECFDAAQCVGAFVGEQIVATKVGGVFHAVRDNETGLLVPPSNSEALAERIVELLDNPAQARAIGQTARETVEREFNVERMVEQTAAVYREVLEPHAVPV